jgi:hypothetical protein
MTDPGDSIERFDNLDAIGRLQGRVRRAGKWTVFYLLLMTVGFILPCILSSVLQNVCLFLLAPVLAIIGLAGFLLMWNDRRKYAGALAVAQQAEALSYYYSTEPPEILMQMLDGFKSFSTVLNYRGLNCCSGIDGGREVAIFEYGTAFRGAIIGPLVILSGAVDDQTVVVITNLADSVPDFCIGPSSALTQDVTGTNAKSRILIDLVLQKSATVEVRGGTMVYFQKYRTIRPEQYSSMIRDALQIAEMLA